MIKTKPLAILTRPIGRNDVIAGQLLEQGWKVLLASVQRVELAKVKPDLFTPPDDFDLIVFVSRAAVEGFCQQLPEGYHWPKRCAIATVGVATSQAVNQSITGDYSLLCPSDGQFDSEALWRLLQAQTLPFRRVLVVRGRQGRQWLIEEMGRHGIDVSVQSVYQNLPVSFDDGLKEALHSHAQLGYHATCLFTSVQALTSVLDQVIELGITDWFGTSAFVVTHEKFAIELNRRFSMIPSVDWSHDVQVCKPEDSAITKCFLSRFSRPRLTIDS